MAQEKLLAKQQRLTGLAETLSSRAAELEADAQKCISGELCGLAVVFGAGFATVLTSFPDVVAAAYWTYSLGCAPLLPKMLVCM